MNVYRHLFVLWLGLAACLLGFSLYEGVASTPPAAVAENPPKPEISTHAQGMLYTFKIPAGSGYIVAPLSSEKLAGVHSPVWLEGQHGKKPIFLINGGFFDPNNALTTSFIVENGRLTGDPLANQQLVGNPKLVPYLPKIFDRTEFRTYLCRKPKGALETRYDIVAHTAPIPEACLLQYSLGAGPQLLPAVQSIEEGFLDHDAAGKVIRDPIGVCAKNARSVVGLTAKEDVLILMGAQNPAQPASTGFTLADMAALLKARGAVKAMALDGGSSSGFWYGGKLVYGKFNKDGTPVKRPVKSVLMVLPQ